MSGLGGVFSRARPRLGGGRLRRLTARVDWPLMIGIALLCAVALLNLHSATYRTANSVKFDNQLVWFAVGLVLLVVLTMADYQSLHRFAWIGLVAVILLIIYVRLFTDPIKGSQRWLSIGSFGRLQPSELAKIAVILALGRLLHDRASGDLARRRLALALAGIAVPVFLVAWQPDLGSAILLALVLVSVGLMVATRLWPVVVGIGLGLACLPILWDRMIPYQKERILCFLDPASDPTNKCWHIKQSILSVGSGRLTGKGYLNATQNHFNFLPEHWTDFPFSVWAEEWGFVGSVALIGIFGFLILWIVHIALRAKDLFGTTICLGVAAMLFWHVVVNVGMVLGLAPVVGVTLPLVSYGGSSVITVFIGLGLVSSVSSRSHT